MDWVRVLNAIEALGDRYPKVNRAISLGLDVKLRRIGVKSAGLCGVAVDVGAGDGSLSREVLTIARPRTLVMLDPMEKMLRRALGSMDRDRRQVADAIVGIVENVPLRNLCADVAYMSFSLRDVIGINMCLSSIRAILKVKGRLLIVDIGRPSSRALYQLFRIYWSFIAPLIAALVAGRSGTLVKEIVPTLDRLPDNDSIAEMLSRYLNVVARKHYAFGAAQILLAEKSGQSLETGMDLRDR